MIDKTFWQKRRVLLTGHTGFKGSWFINWLSELGSDICGYSLEPDNNSLFNYFYENNEKNFLNVYGDINDKDLLEETVIKFQPEIVFHFAAQPLVLESYETPLNTWQTNLIGTLNLLESLKNCKFRCSILIITTDKVYKNKEWIYGYRETDELGGDDFISFQSDNEKFTVIIFTDVDCGYCRKFHNEIADFNNLGITVNYVAFPRSGLDSNSYNKIVTAWCSSYPKETMTQMKQGQDVAISLCKNHPVKKHYLLGQKIGITGTPAIIKSNGELLPGYLPPEELLLLLA